VDRSQFGLFAQVAGNPPHLHLASVGFQEGDPVPGGRPPEAGHLGFEGGTAPGEAGPPQRASVAGNACRASGGLLGRFTLPRRLVPHGHCPELAPSEEGEGSAAGGVGGAPDGCLPLGDPDRLVPGPHEPEVASERHQEAAPVGVPGDRGGARIPLHPLLGRGQGRRVRGILGLGLGAGEGGDPPGSGLGVVGVDDPNVVEVAPLVVPEEGEAVSIRRPGEALGSRPDEPGEGVEPLQGEPGRIPLSAGLLLAPRAERKGEEDRGGDERGGPGGPRSRGRPRSEETTVLHPSPRGARGLPGHTHPLTLPRPAPGGSAHSPVPRAGRERNGAGTRSSRRTPRS